MDKGRVVVHHGEVAHSEETADAVAAAMDEVVEALEQGRWEAEAAWAT